MVEGIRQRLGNPFKSSDLIQEVTFNPGAGSLHLLSLLQLKLLSTLEFWETQAFDSRKDYGPSTCLQL